MDDVNSFLLQGGAKSFPFNDFNDVCKGEITACELRQQSSLEGDLLSWPDGKPRMQLVITLQTTEHDNEDDDGLRTIYAKGGRYEIEQGEGQSMRDAIADAVRAAGAKSIEVGDTLAVAYTGLAPKKRGYSPAKLYTAWFKKAVQSVSAADVFGESPLETGV